MKYYKTSKMYSNVNTHEYKRILQASYEHPKEHNPNIFKCS